MKMNEEQQKAYEKYKAFLEKTGNKTILVVLEEVINEEDEK